MVGLDVGSQQQQQHAGLAAFSNAGPVGMQQVAAIGANQPQQAAQHPPSHTTQPYQHHMAPLPPPPKVLFTGPQQPAASNSSSVPSSAIAGPGGQMPHPTQQPREYLEAVFDQVVATDKEGYFLFPVTEAQAPGYYNTIKNPLCFKDMRMKLAADAYTSWRSLMADFELIISNAKTFNGPKTKCHRCADQLKKNVLKIMSMHELDVRRALGVLQSQAGGPAVSTPPGTLPPPPMPPAATASAGVKAKQQQPVPMVQAVPLATAAATQQPTAQQPLTIPLPPVHVDPLSTVYSDNEDVDQLVLQHQQQLQAGLQAAGRSTQHDNIQPVALEALMSQLRTPVSYEPWIQASTALTAAAADSGLAATCSRPIVTGVTACTANESVEQKQVEPEQQQHFSREWKRARRSLQWQSRWLELRMLELQAQIARVTSNQQGQGQSMPAVELAQTHVAQQQQQQPESQGLGHAAGEGASCAGQGTAGVHKSKERVVAAASRILHGQAPLPLNIKPPSITRLRITIKTDAAGMPKQQAAQQQPRTHSHSVQAAGSLASCTFFSGAGKNMSDMPSSEVARPALPAVAQVEKDEQGDVVMADPNTDSTSQPIAKASHRLGSEPAAAAALQPVIGAVPDVQLPAAVHAALECLELQLSDIKRGLQTSFALDRGQGARARAGPGRAGAYTAQAGTALKRQASTHRAAGAGVHRAGSQALLAAGKLTALDSIKRKRTESDADGQLSPFVSGRILERSMPVSSIFTPQVHELSMEEQTARHEAASTWAVAYAEQGAAALRHPPPAVAASLAAAPEEEGSSSEDTSDEAYIAMHAIMAEEERKRFEAHAAEGQRRRNKQSSKHNQAGGAGGAPDKQGPGTGHGPVGRRASGAVGPKTTAAAHAAAAAQRANMALHQRQQSQQLLAPPPPFISQQAAEQQPQGAAVIQAPASQASHTAPSSGQPTMQVPPQPPPFHATSLQQPSHTLQVDQGRSIATWQDAGAPQEPAQPQAGHYHQADYHGTEPPRMSGTGAGPSHTPQPPPAQQLTSRPNGITHHHHYQNHHGSVASGQPGHGPGVLAPPPPPVLQPPYPQPPLPAPPPPPLKQAPPHQPVTGTQKRASAAGSAPATQAGPGPSTAQRPPRRAAAVAAAAAIAVHPAGAHSGAGAHHYSGGGSLSSRSSTGNTAGLASASDYADGTDSARVCMPHSDEEDFDAAINMAREDGEGQGQLEGRQDEQGNGGELAERPVTETGHAPFQGHSESASQDRSRSHSRSRSVSSGHMAASSPEREPEQGNGSMGGAHAGNSSAEPAIKTGNSVGALQEHARKQKAAAAALPSSNGKTRGSKDRERNGKRAPAATSPRMTRSQDLGKTRSSTNGLQSARVPTTRAQQALQAARRRS